MRVDGRDPDQLRPIRLLPGWVKHPEGSVLVQWGETWVLCNASVQEGVPEWRAGRGAGWLTAEYGMLPRATHTRSDRASLAAGARAQEIRRLIGRSLRAAVDLDKLGERTLILDCDVLQADGGTRTASITGGFVALVLAVRKLQAEGSAGAGIITDYIAATSVGIVRGETLLDLNYAEDSAAEVDMNIVMTGAGQFVELQGTAERGAFADDQLAAMIALGRKGIGELITAQVNLLGPLQ
jgi:ribonuclease PH